MINRRWGGGTAFRIRLTNVPLILVRPLHHPCFSRLLLSSLAAPSLMSLGSSGRLRVIGFALISSIVDTKSTTRQGSFSPPSSKRRASRINSCSSLALPLQMQSFFSTPLSSIIFQRYVSVQSTFAHTRKSMSICRSRTSDHVTCGQSTMSLSGLLSRSLL